MQQQFDFTSALEATLRRELPDCKALVDVERLSGGASMETYRLCVLGADGHQHSFCLRRGTGGVDRDVEHASGLAVEALAMQTARLAGVAEPEVLYVLQPKDGVGAGFVMEWLDGITLGARIVRAPELDKVRPKLAYQCGQELARIHAIDLDATGLREVLRQVSPAEYLDQTWQRYREFPTPQPMIDYTGRWLNENLVTDFSPTLVHNDFRNGNLMIDPDKGLIAVLDWESVHIGDPMRDLGWICTNSWRFGRRDLAVGGFGTFEDLVAGYEAESGMKVNVERVRYWEVFGSFWWAVGCLSMTEHYRTGPDSTVERPAIGRRSSECQVDCANLLIPGPIDLLPSAQQVLADPTLNDTETGQSDIAVSGGDMPTLDELLVSVRDFLHGDVMDATTARTNFLARVAGNTLNTVRRELLIGSESRHREVSMLRELLHPDGEPGSDSSTMSANNISALTNQLRWELVHRLRDGSMPLHATGLREYLRNSVVHQVAIDQPTYSGFVHATTGKVSP